MSTTMMLIICMLILGVCFFGVIINTAILIIGLAIDEYKEHRSKRGVR